jgi:hypothetical protein
MTSPKEASRSVGVQLDLACETNTTVLAVRGNPPGHHVGQVAKELTSWASEGLAM